MASTHCEQWLLEFCTCASIRRDAVLVVVT